MFVNCISIYIMVILDNSRTLGAFERQSRILHILFIIFIFASEKRNILIILIYRFMKKEVTIQNIKFNLSTEPLVSEPEIYPDYPSVQVNQITNKIITNLINYLPGVPLVRIYLQFKLPIRRKLTRANKCWQSLY